MVSKEIPINHILPLKALSILVLFIATIFLTTSFSQAYAATPTVNVLPPAGPPGIQVIITGSGYDSNVPIEIDFIETSSIIVSNTFTDGTGQFAAQVVIPAGAIAPFPALFSAHEIANPSITASIPFSVTVQSIPPSVSLTASPTPAVVGTPETLSAVITDPGCLTCTFPSSFSYSWTLVSRPAGSTDALSSPSVPSPSFIPDLPGDYQVSLVVADPLGHSSAPTFLTISASSCGTCVPTVSPTASPNPATVGTAVTLDANPGDVGCPACIPLFTYQWSMTSPPSSSSLLSDPAIRNPTFTPDVTGSYQLRIVTTDSQGQISTPMFMIVSVVPTPISPVITAPNTITVGKSYTASVTARSGMAYAWSITGGTITGPANPTPSITFTSGTPGTLTLSATETNAAGDTSAPGSVSIAVVGNDHEKGKTVKANILKYNLDVDANGITTDSSWFHEVTGLNSNIDVVEYKEGGKNNSPHKHPGPAVFTKITLLGEYSATTSIPDDYVKNLFKGITLKNEKNNNPTQISPNVLNIALDCNSFSAGGVTFQRVTDQNGLQDNFVITKFAWSNALINTDNGKNALSDWISAAMHGQNIRKNISITLLTSDKTTGHNYNFHECFPTQFSFTPFTASQSIAETITLHHEGATRTR